MRNILESKIEEARFSLTKTVNKLLPLFPIETKRIYEKLERIFGKKLIIDVTRGIIRHAFLIELVKQDVTSTKFEIRWTDKLNGDLRYASYDECLLIFNSLFSSLDNISQDQIKLLQLFSDYNLLPYEMPIDYIKRTNGTPIHTNENSSWFWGDVFFKTITIRSFILTPTKNPEYALFKNILDDKIRVKTYLTDRALTGEHKTNREKRWETHPNSVQFSLRRNCLEIEKILLLQLCCFKEAPATLVDGLNNEELLPSEFDFHRCPITGQELSFTEFRESIENPQHGKSSFQIGHLNPLKAVNDDPSSGHTASNISWLSEDGNRIQGSLTFNEVNDLLRIIFRNRVDLR